MVKKVLIWINIDINQFCISNYLQNISELELFAIIDTNKGKKFYQEQNIVKFKKKWFFRDYISKKYTEPDLEYLSGFEKKYKINLWNIVYSDVIFNEYNNYYKFEENEILSVLEQMCKCYEKIINEVNPQYLMIKVTDACNTRLLQLMCSSLGIKVLSQGSPRFGYRCTFSSDNDVIEEMDYINQDNYNKKNLGELQKYIKGHTEEDRSWGNEFRTSKFQWLKAGIKYLLLTLDISYRNYYWNFGRTPFKAIKTEILFYIKKKSRKKFLDQNSSKTIPNKKFIYFPLQLEPERTLLVPAPYFSDQLEVIKKCAKSIPVDYILVVKEHPMQKLRGWRDKKFYKEILAMPNVILIHPDVSNEEMINKTDLVITITGTSGLEAAFQLKPSIVLANVSYQHLPSVHRIKNIEELPKRIDEFLNVKVSIEDLNNYTNYVLKNSFQFDETALLMQAFNAFHHKGFLFDTEISPPVMKKFIDKNKVFHEALALQLQNIILPKN